MTTRVLIADDHAIVRDGLRRILAADPHFLVCGEARDGQEVIAAVRAGGFDVLLLDLTMPGRSGIELLRQVKAERPELRVLVLTMLDEQEFAVRAIRAGASGYLTKDTVSNQLIEALGKIAAGGLFITPAVAEALALRLQEPEDDLPHRRLSEREYEVFLLLAAGESPSGIARRLHLSVKTVSTHKTNLLQKMRLGSLAELVRYAVAQGLLESSVAPNREAGRSG
jgi:DNA-binding NarL/FixJ family response regulator